MARLNNSKNYSSVTRKHCSFMQIIIIIKNNDNDTTTTNNNDNSRSQEKINHLKYVDDIKLSAKNEKELETLIHAVRIYSQDIGMEFGTEKYAMLVILFTNPSAWAGYDTTSIFKRSLTGLNSEFSFSKTSRLTKAEEPSLPYYLPIAGGRIIGFIHFPRVLVLCEM